MKNILKILIVVLAVGAVIFVLPRKPNSNTGNQGNSTSTLPQTEVNLGPVVVVLPLDNTIIKSPVIIRGRAQGTFFFEASFPIRIIDANGNVLGAYHAQADSDWMTTDFVPFHASIEFSAPSTDTGFIVFKNDNPSGLPEKDQAVKLPVKFK